MVPLELTDADHARPSAGTEAGDDPRPELGSVLKRVALNLLVACAVPAVVFTSLFLAFGIWPAILAALAWSYGAIAVSALHGRRTSGMLLLTAGVLTLRTTVALLAQSTFVYFLQPVLTDLVVGAAFLVSVATARPVVARLAGDFYPLTEELHARPGLQRLFRRLTVLWSGALLAKAVVVFALLQTQPLTTFVLAKGIVVPLTNAGCIALTVLIATVAARREGLLAARATILPTWPSRTSPATS
jgi:intracellular septation protein A